MKAKLPVSFIQKVGSFLLKFNIIFSPKKIYNTLRYYFGSLYYLMDDHHIFLFSGGLAFSIFICIIPFILILFWILGNFLDPFTIKVQIATILSTAIPYEQYVGEVKDILFQRISEMIVYKDLAGYIGLGGLMFAASGFSSSIRTILNTVFANKDDVSVIRGKMRDFALIFITVIFLLATTFLFPVLDALRGASEFVMELKFLKYGIFQEMFTTGISFVLLTVFFSILYRFVPTQKIRKRSGLVGALWAAGLWEGMKLLFGYYISNIATFGQIYGAYAFIVVIAFWIYYSSIVFILGAEIGKLFNDNPYRSWNKHLHPVQKKTGKSGQRKAQV
ncbi:MAG: YihY/virulence factor BrkB family protein [Ignavibacteriales bacterium]|nr:YihY/virulence factor BrkB family protein [Ignavibacteriales bacterium]